MKFTVGDLIKKLENHISPEWQESYDNIGLQIGSYNRDLTGVLLCLDVTFDALTFAVNEGINLIISHHPLFFHPLKSISLDTEHGKLIAFSIEHGMNIYSMHTNLDKSILGINFSIAEALKLTKIRVLSPEKKRLKKLVTYCPHDFAEQVRQAIFEAGAGVIGNYDSCSYNVEGYGTFRGNELTNPFVGEQGKLHKEPETRIETIFPAEKESAIINALLTSHPYEEVAYDIYQLDNEWHQVGLGAIGELPEAMSETDFLDLIKTTFSIPFLRFTKGSSREIKRVAVCGGSGISLLQRAIALEADAFVTADVKYHEFQQAEGKIYLIDAGHYETEMVGLKKIYQFISELLYNFAKVKIYTSQNIVQYR